MKVITVLSIIVILIGCKPMKHVDVPGKYIFGDSERTSEIYFSSNGDFTFQQNSLGVVKSCKGTYKILTKNKIHIKCENREDLPYVLSTAFMDPIDDYVFLFSKNKIKLGKIVLTRSQ